MWDRVVMWLQRLLLVVVVAVVVVVVVAVVVAQLTCCLCLRLLELKKKIIFPCLLKLTFKYMVVMTDQVVAVGSCMTRP